MNSLIFGSTGSIGNYIYTKFIEEKINIIGTTSKKENITENIKENIIFVDNDNLTNLNNINK